MSALAQGLSELLKPRFDFATGQFRYDISGHIPKDIYQALLELETKKKEGSDISDQLTPFETTIMQIHEEETSLRPSEDRIRPMHTSARGAIDYTFSQILKKGEQAIIPVPNWTFWHHLEGYKKKDYGFRYFNASDPDQLVEGFRKAASKRKAKAMILVDPSNPLGYRLTQDVCLEIDSIAEKEGITVVVDDLLRGNQPVGSRESIAAYFSRPYVVEGFSHRFGENPLGNISYIIVPEGNNTVQSEKIKTCLCAELLKVAYQYATESVLEELAERNRLFDESIRKAMPDLNVYRASDSSISGTVELPESVSTDAAGFARHLRNSDIYLYPIAGFMPNWTRTPRGLRRTLRFSVGTIYRSMIPYGSQLLGQQMKEMVRT
jgi:aspartate/methionine/tyrosine aminotransferase